MIVFHGVGIHHVLKEVARALFAEDKLIQITKAHDEVSHARIERQPLARRARFVPHPFEQWQMVVGSLAIEDMPQDFFHFRRPFLVNNANKSRPVERTHTRSRLENRGGYRQPPVCRR